MIIHRTKDTINYIHLNLWGSFSIMSKYRAQYLLLFINDHPIKIWMYFLKRKSDVFITFKKGKVLIKKQTSKKIKRLRANNGLEFRLGQFDKFRKNKGIARNHTIRNTP